MALASLASCSTAVHAYSSSQTLLLQAESQFEQTPLTSAGASDKALPLTVYFHPRNSQSDSNSASFDPALFFKHLRSRGLGHLLLSAAVLPSTQTLLQQNSRTLPDGTVCVADQQAAGKGRGGNQWTSPLGCLMFSFHKVVRLSGDRLPFLQYLVSLAIVQAVQQTVSSALQGNIDIRIKWPNDIYAAGQKIGGILCHSAYRDQQFFVTVGCGINVTNSQPTTCINALVAEQAMAQMSPEPAKVQREVLLAYILTEFERLLDILATEGFEPLRQSYLNAWLHSGQQVTLVEGEAPAATEVRLTVQGVTSSGYLLAHDADGRSFELHPDGNSLDFFKGLVRRKLPAANP